MLTASALREVFNEQPQSQPVIGRETDMVENSAGGFVFTINEWDHLDRFLILGTEGGSYYASQQKLTLDNVKHVKDLVDKDGLRVVDRVVEMSTNGRVPKNDQCLFVLAMCAAFGDENTRFHARANLFKVARIGTHLFQFVDFYKSMKDGFGRGIRRAINNWYYSHQNAPLQILKYRQRGGWSHRDLLRITHPRLKDQGDVIREIFKWATHPDTYQVVDGTTPPLLREFLALQTSWNPTMTAKLLEDSQHGLSHEMIPTEHKGSPEVWKALMTKMPMTALIRNLPTLTRHDLLKPMSDATVEVARKISDHEKLTRARVHPIQMLIAQTTYSGGRSIRGSTSWTPVPEVSDALEEGFYAAFKGLTPIDKNVYVGVDVSSSMTWGEIAGTPGLTPHVGAAAMAVVLARQCDRSYVQGFASGDRTGWSRNTAMRDLGITKNTSLKEAMNNAKRMGFGGTDCALPMLDALEQKLEVDTFVVITDSETWAGSIHPFKALRDYRKKMNRPAKLVVLGMTSTNFTIADPNDSGMIDFVGFDAAVPKILEGFMNS